jgi:hypothetical protein
MRAGSYGGQGAARAPWKHRSQGASTVSKRVLLVTSALVLGLLTASPVSAERGSVDRIGSFGTVLAVASPDNFPFASLMRAECSSLVRVQRSDGSAMETQICTLSDDPVMIPEFQGTPPQKAFQMDGGACTWTSDYWWNVADSPVYADSFSYIVTPSGAVRATSTYPAHPIACE